MQPRIRLRIPGKLAIKASPINTPPVTTLTPSALATPPAPLSNPDLQGLTLPANLTSEQRLSILAIIGAAAPTLPAAPAPDFPAINAPAPAIDAPAPDNIAPAPSLLNSTPTAALPANIPPALVSALLAHTPTPAPLPSTAAVASPTPLVISTLPLINSPHPLANSMAHQDAVQMADLLVEQKTSTKKKGAAATKAPTSTTAI